MLNEVKRQLEAKGYTLQAQLNHVEIAEFIRPYFFRKNPVMLFYAFFNFFLLGFLIFHVVLAERTMNSIFLIFGGMFLFAIVIPIHELIHGLFYRLAGAKNVSYKAVWRKFIFYAMADGFVTSKIPFLILAMAPFVIINSILIVLLFFVPEASISILYGLLFMHTAGCSGDFALLSYFYSFWEKDPLTFDDVEAGVSYFYIKYNSK